ncbi:MAG: thrombospondin type 3 repeat-containing protein, partial [Anaerolineae bacterium]
MKLHTEPKAPVQAWTGRRKVFKIIQSVVIAGLLLAHFAGAARPAYASPWTPLAWQDGGKLQGWIRDTDGNFVDDLIDEIAIILQSRAAYIYLADDFTAVQYAELLAGNGTETTLVPLGEVPRTDLSAYDLILIGPDTGEGDAWGDPEVVQAINGSGKPILALGTGGSAFLQQLGLTIGSAHGYPDVGAALYVADPDLPIYNTPNQLDVGEGSILTLYDSDVRVTYIDLPRARPDVSTLGRHADDEGLYPLLLQDIRYTAWNFDGSPSEMTEAGRDLFINIVNHALTFAPGIDTLILTNYQRMVDIGYAFSSVNNLANKVYQLATLPTSQSKMSAIMRDLTINAPDYVKNAYTAWAGNESDITKTNALAAAIRKYIRTLKTGSFYNLKYVILVGSHEVIPMEARSVPAPWDSGSESIWSNQLPQKSGYLYDIYHNTQGSPRGYFLSDLIYRNWSHVPGGVAFYPGKWIDDEYLPELSVGRLIETPDQILGVLNAYVARQGNLSRLNMSVIASRDFTKAGGWAAKYMGTTADTTLVRDCAGFAENTGNCFPSSLVPPKLNAKHDIVFLAGHGSFNSLTTQKWHYSFMAGSDPSQGDTSELNPLPGAVIVSGGSCHLGLNLGNKLYHAPDGTTTYADFPEEFAAKQVGVYIGATTIAFGDCCAKKLEADFIDKLLNTSYKQTAGQAQLDAIKQYLSDHNSSSGMGIDIHRQTLAASTFYGMPTYGWKAPLRLKMPSDYGISRFCIGCPFRPFQDEITWRLSNWDVTHDGLIEIEGASYGSGGVDLPILPRVAYRRMLPRGASVSGVVWDQEASESVVLQNDVPLDTASWVNNTLDGIVSEGTGVFDYDGFYPPLPYEPLIDPITGGNALQAGLTLTPVQYNPTTHETRIWTKLVFTIDYDVSPEDLNFDGDGDTLPHYWEAGYGLDRYSADGEDGPDGDPDGDGLRNADELERGTDPLNPDSDNDGEWDSQEAEAGTDPLDPR